MVTGSEISVNQDMSEKQGAKIAADDQKSEAVSCHRTCTALSRIKPDMGGPSCDDLSGSLDGVNSEFRIATKWPYNWSAEPIFGATGTAGRAPSF